MAERNMTFPPSAEATALAERLERLASDLPAGPYDHDAEEAGQVNNAEGYHVASFSGTCTDWLATSELFVLVRNNLPTILAALRHASAPPASTEATVKWARDMAEYSDYRRKKARRAWRWMERYMLDECGLIERVGGEANTLRNAIINTLPEPSLMEATIKFLSSGEGLHKVRVGEKMMTRRQLVDALRTWMRTI